LAKTGAFCQALAKRKMRAAGGFANVWQNGGNFAKHWQNAESGRKIAPPGGVGELATTKGSFGLQKKFWIQNNFSCIPISLRYPRRRSFRKVFP
jgi:hypothetical protein